MFYDDETGMICSMNEEAGKMGLMMMIMVDGGEVVCVFSFLLLGGHEAVWYEKQRVCMCLIHVCLMKTMIISPL
jgi:hypothetical protein